MTPPQNQPAVTNREIAKGIIQQREATESVSMVFLIERALDAKDTERDEALREVERINQQIEEARNYRGLEGYACFLCSYDNGVFVRACVPHQQLEAEKRRAAAYRQVAIEMINPDAGSAQLKWAESNVDREAQKLLADSGGEKKA